MGTTVVKCHGLNLFVPPQPIASFQTNLIPTVTTLPGDLGNVANKWQGGALAPNGKIYCIPVSETRILVIDPVDDSFYFITGLPADISKWRGGAIAPNGKIYCAPAQRKEILVIDTNTDTYYTINVSNVPHINTSASAISYLGAASGQNGAIYFNPAAAGYVLKLDPTDDSFTTIGDYLGNTSFKYGSSQVAFNGDIIMNPSFAPAVLRINPATDTVTSFGDRSNINKSYSLVTLNDGRMLAMPWATTSMIDPDNSTYDAWDVSGTTSEFAIGGLLAANGKIYYCPGTTPDRVHEYTPETNTLTPIGPVLSGSGVQYAGCIMSLNGDIYGVPRNAEAIVKIALGTSLMGVHPSLYSAYRNNF